MPTPHHFRPGSLKPYPQPILLIKSFSRASMEGIIAELQPYRDRLPLFILKLYHILGLPKYAQYMGWHNGHVAIRQAKNVVYERVLKHFFKLKNFTSFVRQLNIYGFRKAPCVVQRKHFMLFTHPHFRPGQVQNLLLIKRRPSKTQEKLSVQSITLENEENPSIENDIPPQNPPETYTAKVEQTAVDIVRTLQALQEKYPGVAHQIEEVIRKCQTLDTAPKRQSTWADWDIEPFKEGMCFSQQAIPHQPQPFFPSMHHL